MADQDKKDPERDISYTLGLLTERVGNVADGVSRIEHTLTNVDARVGGVESKLDVTVARVDALETARKNKPKWPAVAGGVAASLAGFVSLSVVVSWLANVGM